MKELNQKNFDKETLKNKTPTIIDFWADWCIPCKMLSPILNELAKFYGKRIMFAKVNTEKEPELVAKFAIEGIPTLLVMDKGEVIDRIVGFAPKDIMKKKIDDILLKIK
mgnify:FL=1